jgi:hypothetical protein
LYSARSTACCRLFSRPLRHAAISFLNMVVMAFLSADVGNPPNTGADAPLG